MIEMMLTGRSLYAKQAKRMGIVDAVTEERHIREAINWAIAGKLKTRRGQTKKAKAMNFGPSRALIAMQMEKQVKKRAKQKHYPAPCAMIDLWREHGNDLDDMRTAETDSFARLMTGDTSKNLVRAFQLREKLKEHGKGVDHDIRHVQAALSPDLPVAGFFAAGEIGPVGGRNFLHGFTASVAVFRARD